ncbi:AAA family ATPase [Lactococcus garvieae]|uniref:AAA family ATPase n=1 Tax=Lactococcus garvieae TaxID=1363 RepID=UPI00254FC983|nr:AAA family ATPase [Lactococcus garvieae]
MVKKLDFHIHTISSGKDSKFSYSSDWMKRYVEEAELDAIAITNHDLFDLENFEQVKKDLPDTAVFPGMELSLEEGHVNIVFSEDEVSSLIDFSAWLERNSYGEKAKISTEDFCRQMVDWENGIYIFELGKSNSLKVPEKLSGVTFVGGVSSQLRFQSFYKKEELTPVLFSDAHASEDETEEKRKNIKFLKNKNTFIQVDNCTFSEIKNCISNRNKVAINKESLNNVVNVEDHRVSTGLNLIVGKRGTGKTEFLKKVKEQYDLEDIYEISQFETSKSDEYIKKQGNDQGQVAFENWKQHYSTQLSAIQDYLKSEEDNHQNEIDNFLNSVKGFAKYSPESESKQKYKLLKQSGFEDISTQSLEKYLKDLGNLIDSHDLWQLLRDSDNKREVFIETYNELRNLFILKQKQNKLQKESNAIQNSIKRILEVKTGLSPVIDCEFSKIIQKEQTEKAIEKFLEKIVHEQQLDKKNIHGYQVIVKLSPFENANQFKNAIGTKDAVKDDLIKPYTNKNYIGFLKNLKKKTFFKIANLADYLLHLDVKLLDSDGTPASGGQAVGFALMLRLEDARMKPIVLIDEPEASLDNAYIREELIKAIRSLASQSTVFVVTHNSTLGALLEPDYLVVTSKNQQKEYKVLTGEFSSCLISEASGHSENSYSKFVEAMESGIAAYNKKGVIYESLRN